jgi:hypothetical protein
MIGSSPAAVEVVNRFTVNVFDVSVPSAAVARLNRYVPFTVGLPHFGPPGPLTAAMICHGIVFVSPGAIVLAVVPSTAHIRAHTVFQSVPLGSSTDARQ